NRPPRRRALAPANAALTSGCQSRSYRAMRTAYRVAAIVVAIVFLIVLTLLAHYQNGVPPHQEQHLPGGEPATMYLPGSSNPPGPDNPFFRPFPSPLSRDRLQSSSSTGSRPIASTPVRWRGESRRMAMALSPSMCAGTVRIETPLTKARAAMGC